MNNQTIDNLDKNIINALMANARVPYAELAKQFAVSPATIHVRIEKLKTMGVITGTHMHISEKALGYDVCCFIGINLKSAGDYPDVLAQLEQIDEVLEVYYTTGQYSIFIKIMARSIDDLQWLLIDKIQSIDQVQATETLISLQNPIARPVKV
ncbi:MAG: transcriptional regulator AsnC [Kangiellaceae bacterium]|jgi:Lrp/AsnC family transcriptional regulator for asnA, asnC and gidA|nr:transcriptional regulator AsnC [Kangiellaceae bacterium]